MINVIGFFKFGPDMYRIGLFCDSNESFLIIECIIISENVRHPGQDELGLDSVALNGVPRLVVNRNQTTTMLKINCGEKVPIFAANIVHFQKLSVVFNAGMKDVYAVCAQYIQHSDILMQLEDHEYPLSSSHECILQNVPLEVSVFDVRNKMFENFRFRSNLSEKITKALLKSKGRG